jgi:hypothetical protein
MQTEEEAAAAGISVLKSEAKTLNPMKFHVKMNFVS